MNLKAFNMKKFVGIFILIAFTFFGLSVTQLVESVDTDEIMVIQDPIDGELHWYTTAGIKSQMFGKVTKYPKSFQFWFSEMDDQGDNKDQSMKTRFNDGGHGRISGSVRCNYPMDIDSLTALHQKYGSHEAVYMALVRPVFEKAVYMTGPLMSSKESYSEKRNELIRYIEDQALYGVYKTKSTEKKGVDTLSGKEKTITVVEILEEEGAINGFARQENSPLSVYKIQSTNLSINSIKYDETVERQIAVQQKAIMDVQTAIAQAKKAEQDAIKVEKEGEANAARAKWEQEKINAKEIAEAEKLLTVAKLERLAAAETKEKEILLGQGEAERKKLVMFADGALDKKLNAWVESQKVWASAYASRNVPGYYIAGGEAASPDQDTQLFMKFMTANMASEIGLDMSVPKGAQTSTRRK